jgi:predicted DNA-binding transcriptional regulator AlpA
VKQPLSLLHDPILTPEQVAAMFGLSPRTIEGWRQAGKGPEFIELGKNVAYRLSAVEAFVAKQTRTISTPKRRRVAQGGAQR